MAGAASWSFNENDFKQIQTHLQAFLRDSNARCALLVDRNGQLVATVGDTPKFDPTAFGLPSSTMQTIYLNGIDLQSSGATPFAGQESAIATT